MKHTTTDIWKLLIKEKILISKNKISELVQTINKKLKEKGEEYLIPQDKINQALLFILNKISTKNNYTEEDLFNVNNMYKLFDDITVVKEKNLKDLEKIQKLQESWEIIDKNIIIKLWKINSIIDGFIEFYSKYLEDLVSRQKLSIKVDKSLKIDGSKILFINKKNKKLALNLIREIVQWYILQDLKITKTTYKDTLIYKLLNSEWKYVILWNVNSINLFK